MGDGVVHLVLAAGEEVPSRLRVRVIVVADLAEQVGDLLPEPTLAGADVADAVEQFLEIVVSERSAVLEHVVVEGESLDDVFA